MSSLGVFGRPHKCVRGLNRHPLQHIQRTVHITHPHHTTHIPLTYTTHCTDSPTPTHSCAYTTRDYTHTHTPTHTRRCRSVKVPTACRAWPGAETHRKGQGSQPGSLHLGLLASAGRSQATSLLCWSNLQDPRALGRRFVWQQQNIPSRL